MTSSAASLPVVIESSDIVKVKHADGTKTLNGFRVRKELLGSGSFANVKLCEQEGSAEKFALKVFRKLRLRRQREFTGGGDGGGMKVRTSLDKVYDEIAVMKKIMHPNCVRLYAVFDEADASGKLYLVIEYAARGPAMEWDVDRCSYLVPATGAVVPEMEAKSHVQDILSGLSYIHSIEIAHRDIKPQNLLVDSYGRLKIADFGVATQMSKDYLVNGTEGTYYFFSPEMCSSGYKGHDGRRADVWATGVSLWAFLFGSLPFFHADLVSLLDSIAVGSYELPPDEALSEGCRALLIRLLTVDPAQRPLPDELLADSWCRGVASQGPGQVLSQSGSTSLGLPRRAGLDRPDAMLIERGGALARG